jgi:hypothetical protein
MDILKRFIYVILFAIWGAVIAITFIPVIIIFGKNGITKLADFGAWILKEIGLI